MNNAPSKRPFKGKKDFKKQKPRLRHKADLWGTHAVTAAWLNPDREVKALYITDAMLESFRSVMKEAAGLQRPEPQIIDKKEMDRMLPGAVHQGIAVDVAPLPETFVMDLVARTAAHKNSTILILDQVTDPHNVGAILRSACAFGVDGMVMQRKNSPELTGVLAKTATGAVEHVPVAYEINLSDTIDTLKGHGFTVIGLDEHAETIADVQKGGKIAFVLGAEGTGMRPKVKEHCDQVVSLPTVGPIESLNVSNAAAIALYALNN